MDFLTVKEYAELKECSERYVKRLCKEGKIPSEQRPHPQNKKLCYMIPVSALSEELKIKYYKNLKSGVKLAPELNESPVLKSSKKTVKKRLEEYTESERNEIAL